MDKVRSFFAIALITTGLLLGGCGKQETPQESAQRFFQQVLAGQTAEAYGNSAFAFQAEQTQRAFETAARDLKIIGAKSAELQEGKVDLNSAKFDVEVTKADGTKLAMVVQLRNERGKWKVHSLRTKRSIESGLVENRFSLVGRGTSFTDSLNRPVPDEDTVKALIAETMQQFNEALLAGSFEEFYKNIAPSWQKQLSDRQLQRAFQAFIDRKIDLTEALKLEAVLDEQPQISSDGLLVITGHYPWKPYRAFFNLKYMHEANEWRLFGIDVNLKR